MQTDIMQTIRANFDRIRTAKGITVQSIADKKGVTRQTIYSHFRPGASINTICKIADLIGAQPYELLKPVEADQGAPAQARTIQPAPAVILCPHCARPIVLKATTPQDETTQDGKPEE